ncbi:Golgi Phosphoprotein 3 [Manis pentadactyla]|nr:Golgi Phosphoprotein 3 [Manis pentadactyla]
MSVAAQMKDIDPRLLELQQKEGLYFYTSEFWSELGSSGKACTSLSELHLTGESQDQMRSELERSARQSLPS